MWMQKVKCEEQILRGWSTNAYDQFNVKWTYHVGSPTAICAVLFAL